MLNITTSRKLRKQGVELNMAPMIDMVFILLIFFLVSTSFVRETGIEINRPTAATAEKHQKDNILVAINSEGQIYMDNRSIDVRAVRANVERALAENPEGGVVIVADRESRTGTVLKVMDSCRLAGAANVSLAAGLPASE